MDRCSASVVYFINKFCRTCDTREDFADLPFKLFPRQEELVLWLEAREENRERGLVEKSRDTGVTWVCCAFALQRWCFRPNCHIGFGSRKLELVDRLGDMDSIFEKIRYMLDRLPPWLLPEGYDRNRHDNLAKIINPANGSILKGEGGDDIGRGGRSRIFFVDEAASLLRPDGIERSLSATTEVRIDVSTPKGMGNPFAARRFSGKIPVFTISYRDDPRKTEEWARKKRAEHDEITWRQEFEIDYTCANEGTLIPGDWVRAAVNFPVEESGELIAGLDIAEEGMNRTVLISRRGPKVFDPIAWQKKNTTETAWLARDEANRLDIAEIRFDCNGCGAGVRGTWDTAEEMLGFRTVPVNTGESPTDTEWPDGKTSKEKFLNLRAELWWLLRCRFERTYEVVQGVANHPPEECISLPECSELIAELSLPLYFHTDRGKVKVEGKESMRKRGIASPDFADALVLSFYPDNEEWYSPGILSN